MEDVTASNHDDTHESKVMTPMDELNLALQACKFGRFHIRLLFTTFIAIIVSVSVGSSTSYILPIAECDLDLSLVKKGSLNAAPYAGMLCSSIIGGYLTDTFGRNLFVKIGNGGIFIFAMVAGFSQSYEVLITALFCEGVLFAVSFNAFITLTSEFCHKGIRDRVLLAQSSLVSISQCLVIIIAWTVLTQDLKYSLFNGYIVLNTWNFYLIIMSIWPLASCFFYMFLPESPKYLLTQHKYKEVKDILTAIYTENTGKPADTFPYTNLWNEQIREENLAKGTKTTLSHQMMTGLHNMKSMFQRPLILYLIMICLINLVIMLTYNGLRLWFPQLSTIVEYYSIDSEGNTRDLCNMLDSYTNDLKLKSNNVTGSHICVPKISGTETYINNIIVACVGFLPFVITGFLVNKISKKYLLIVGGLISVGTTLGIRWAGSKSAVVSLFSLEIAITKTMVSLNQSFTMEFFPTTIRSLALAIMMTLGRSGSILGNVTFPILLNMGCYVPFMSLSGLMIFAVLILTLLPTKKKK